MPIPKSVDVEILRNVLCGADSHRASSANQEFLLRLSRPDSRCIEYRDGDHTIAHVVQSLEVPAARHGDAPLPKEKLDGLTSIRPTPPRTRALSGDGYIAGSDRSA